MQDNDESIDRLLDGWGTPEAKPDFADRVLRRIAAPEPPRSTPRLRSRALTFVLGGVVGGLAVASVTTLRDGPRATAPPSFERLTHLHAPGVAEVVGEPGSRLHWQRSAGGEFALEVVRGVAWVRRATDGPAFRVVVDGEAVALDGPCTRLEVKRSFLSVDATVDGVDCARVDATIEQARAELSRPRSR
ncbi:hypothetical protein [Nannocystis punicea]|uniref:Uncharacterized protein n=1 Tax=Nannocystis punicea TaxID=2995304 RepID=A0ABY7GW58_9BACT|nr:hypothetical protein [Nannocystis poenicansa]WAS91191.1 hypothetical protein O0S08_33810 [Nannocystis poenicansa]